MAAIASLSLLFKADMSVFSKALKAGKEQTITFAGAVKTAADAAEQALGGIGRSATASLAALRQAGPAAASALGVATVAAAGLTAAVAGGIDRIDQLTDTAAQLGVTTEALSSLRYAADLTGSSAADLDGALEKLNANLGDAAQKATPASDALARLGLDAKQLASIPADQAFRKIVGGFEAVPNAADRASLAMDIFGKGGLKILNTLASGSGEIDRLAQEAARFGVAVNQVDAAKIGAAKDSLDRAGMAVQGLSNQLAVALAPAIEVAATEMTAFLQTTVAEAGGVNVALEGIVSVFGWIGDWAQWAEEKVQRFMVGFVKAGNAVASWDPFRNRKAVQENMDFARVFEENVNRAFAVKPSDRIARFFEDVRSKADAAALASARAAKANIGAKVGGAADSAEGGIGKGVAELTERLREQAAVFGLNAMQADLYKLKLKGATDQQLAGAYAAARQIQAMEQFKASREREAKADEDDRRAAESLFAETRTEAEKLADQLAKINLLKTKGLISGETAARATRKATGDGTRPSGEIQLAGAAKLGSAEAYTTIVNAISGRTGDGIKDVARNTSRMASGITKLVELTGRGGVRPMGGLDDVTFVI